MLRKERQQPQQPQKTTVGASGGSCAHGKGAARCRPAAEGGGEEARRRGGRGWADAVGRGRKPGVGDGGWCGGHGRVLEERRAVVSWLVLGEEMTARRAIRHRTREATV